MPVLSPMSSRATDGALMPLKFLSTPISTSDQSGNQKKTGMSQMAPELRAWSTARA